MRIDDALDGLKRAVEQTEKAAQAVRRAAEAQKRLTEATLKLRDAARHLAQVMKPPTIFTPEQDARLEKAIYEIDAKVKLARN